MAARLVPTAARLAARERQPATKTVVYFRPLVAQMLTCPLLSQWCGI